MSRKGALTKSSMALEGPEYDDEETAPTSEEEEGEDIEEDEEELSSEEEGEEMQCYFLVPAGSIHSSRRAKNLSPPKK